MLFFQKSISSRYLHPLGQTIAAKEMLQIIPDTGVTILVIFYRQLNEQ